MMTKKKGTIILKKDNQLKVCYTHRNAHLAGIGKKIVKMCRELGTEGLKELYNNIILVDETTPMTPEQIEAYQKYIPEQLRKNEMTWTEALLYTKDATEPLIDGFPYMVDYANFSGSWRNRFRYLLDLDNGVLIIIKAGLEMISQKDEEYYADAEYVDKIAHTVIGKFPIDNIPENWIEMCETYWHSLMIIAVDYSGNEEALYSEKIQSEASIENDHDYEKCKFFYGDNSYNELFSGKKSQ